MKLVYLLILLVGYINCKTINKRVLLDSMGK